MAEFREYTKEEAREGLARLAERYGRDERANQSTDYLEGSVRTEYINGMFRLLNWDVSNQKGVAPRFRDVVSEAGVQVDGVRKRPDYAFCIGGAPVFLVEAKAPSVKVLHADGFARQLRQYAFASRCPVSVLTDFGELAVYDTRKRPGGSDTADVARVKYIRFDQYGVEFDYLWDTFSHGAVIRGSIDRYFDREDGNYDVRDVDEEVLRAVDEWRTMLLASVEAKGWKVSRMNINTAVQRLVNRLVYIWRTKGL